MACDEDERALVISCIVSADSYNQALFLLLLIIEYHFFSKKQDKCKKTFSVFWGIRKEGRRTEKKLYPMADTQCPVPANARYPRTPSLPDKSHIHNCIF